jgi:hypothetical protein
VHTDGLFWPSGTGAQHVQSIGQRAEHPVGHRSQVPAMLFESLR